MLTKASLLHALESVPNGTRVYLTLDADGEQVRPIDELRIEEPTACRPSPRVVLLPAYRKDEWGTN